MMAPTGSSSLVNASISDSMRARRSRSMIKLCSRPAWSGGASSVGKRKLYVYESEELPGIVAHELTHIYFDGFFLDGTTDPLWLSEGMATLVE